MASILITLASAASTTALEIPDVARRRMHRRSANGRVQRRPSAPLCLPLSLRVTSTSRHRPRTNRVFASIPRFSGSHFFSLVQIIKGVVLCQQTEPFQPFDNLPLKLQDM